MNIKNLNLFFKHCQLWILTLAVLAVSGNALATPRYAAKYGQSCNLCHVNPTGAGMRTLYGAQFFCKVDMQWTPEEDFESIEDYKPKVNESFQYGGDYRSIYWTQGTETDTSDNSMNSFLTMQADVYFAIMPADKLLIYIEKGIGSAFEAFVLMRGLTETGILKVGRFVPSFGWRFDDHKSYAREFLGYSSYPVRGVQVAEDSGVEFGLYPMEWEFSTSITNGTIANSVAGGIDLGNEGKAVTARALRRLSLGGISLTLGGSYRYAEFGKNPPVSRYAGGFWGANYSNWTLVGETDWVLRDDITSLVTTQLLSYQVRTGLNIFGGYDYWDPNIDVKTDDSIFTRYKVGLNYYPTSYYGLSPVYYYHEEEGVKIQSTELMLRVWF